MRGNVRGLFKAHSMDRWSNRTPRTVNLTHKDLLRGTKERANLHLRRLMMQSDFSFEIAIGDKLCQCCMVNEAVRSLYFLKPELGIYFWVPIENSVGIHEILTDESGVI